MRKKGSMTVTMSLVMLVLIALIATWFQGIEIVCARSLAVNAIDTGLYSLFSEYDEELQKNYHLFFLDSSYGTGKINAGQLINQIEYYMNPILSSGLLECETIACGAEGLRLATDQNGKSVEQQMIRYMKKNIGIEEIRDIKSKISQWQKILSGQQSIKDAGISETVLEGKQPMEGISQNNNPLEFFRNIKNNGFLGLVLPDGKTISTGQMNLGNTVSKRQLQQGFGDFSMLARDSSSLDKLWIQEYIFDHMDTYIDQKKEENLCYEAEYILGGKASDKENLSYVVRRLLFLREVSNIAYLYTDATKRGELEACAAALSLLALIPEGTMLVQGILAAGWAYVESISDVKIILSGGKVPLVKDHNSWKTQLNHLSVDTTVTGNNGLDYEGYLRMLFLMSSKEEMVFRSMDLIEQNIRTISGKKEFSMDACLDAASFSILLKGPREKTWQATRIYSYDM